eukprot:11000078-Alexandrium_andersonii.AAC.1
MNSVWGPVLQGRGDLHQVAGNFLERFGRYISEPRNLPEHAHNGDSFQGRHTKDGQHCRWQRWIVAER